MSQFKELFNIRNAPTVRKSLYRTGTICVVPGAVIIFFFPGLNIVLTLIATLFFGAGMIMYVLANILHDSHKKFEKVLSEKLKELDNSISFYKELLRIVSDSRGELEEFCKKYNLEYENDDQFSDPAYAFDFKLKIENFEFKRKQIPKVFSATGFPLGTVANFWRKRVMENPKTPI